MSFARQRVSLPEPILCFYINRTPHTQLARFVKASQYNRDRVVRPNEHLLFEAAPGTVLEIHMLTEESTTLLNSFSCKELKVSNELIETMLRWLA
ncbi:MAG: DUF1830 domain-containing protein [Leptolyngbyaceae cyanobacterium bins.349]|nr:DUF1830 domain-containing protein [Leptolyngbyaceae cyanobacterium bins.349]